MEESPEIDEKRRNDAGDSVGEGVDEGAETQDCSVSVGHHVSICRDGHVCR